jgi:hypothetical protein
MKRPACKVGNMWKIKGRGRGLFATLWIKLKKILEKIWILNTVKYICVVNLNVWA